MECMKIFPLTSFSTFIPSDTCENNYMPGRQFHHHGLSKTSSLTKTETTKCNNYRSHDFLRAVSFTLENMTCCFQFRQIASASLSRTTASCLIPTSLVTTCTRIQPANWCQRQSSGMSERSSWNTNPAMPLLTTLQSTWRQRQ